MSRKRKSVQFSEKLWMRTKSVKKLLPIGLSYAFTWEIIDVALDKQAIVRKKPPMTQLFVVANIVEKTGFAGLVSTVDGTAMVKIGGPL